jgi:hypothetical protein
MNAPVRSFEIKPAVREQVPLLIGLMGPPGAGKTYSALTLADGMREVAGGPAVLIDTEGGRSKKYADLFNFQRMDFAAPFKPSDFLAAIRQAVTVKPCAIIIDSMSDEHEGEGGVLDWHDTELDRMAGADWAKRERVGQAAWIKPKADRRSMINGLLQIQIPLIFCFRAREKVKQVKDERGTMVPTNIGYMPIAPSEIVHAMDLNCVLPPKSDGVPVWRSDKMGEDFIIKLPEFFKSIFTEGRPITKTTGKLLAEWAKGGTATPQTKTAAAQQPVSPDVPHTPPGEAGRLSVEDMARAAAERGWSHVMTYYDSQTTENKSRIKRINAELKTLCPADDPAPT